MAQVDLTEVHRSAITNQRFLQVVLVAKDYVDHPVNLQCCLTYSKLIYVQLQLGVR